MRGRAQKIARGSWLGARGNCPEPTAQSPQRISNRAPNPQPRAVTLIELLVVMGVIALIAGMSIPGFMGYAKQVRLKTTTRQMVGLLSLARSMAISSRADHAVVIDPAEQMIRVVNVGSGEALEQVVRIPSSVTVAIEFVGLPSEVTQIAFQPTGSLGGRTTTVVLSDGVKRQTITVVGATGAIILQ